MQDQETKQALENARAANQVKTWRRADKRAISEKTSCAREALYHETQKLRQVADTLEHR